MIQRHRRQRLGLHLNLRYVNMFLNTLLAEDPGVGARRDKWLM